MNQPTESVGTGRFIHRVNDAMDLWIDRRFVDGLNMHGQPDTLRDRLTGGVIRTSMGCLGGTSEANTSKDKCWCPTVNNLPLPSCLPECHRSGTPTFNVPRIDSASEPSSARGKRYKAVPRLVVAMTADSPSSFFNSC